MIIRGPSGLPLLLCLVSGRGAAAIADEHMPRTPTHLGKKEHFPRKDVEMGSFP